MKAFIFGTDFKVVSAWADHAAGLRALMRSKWDERYIFWSTLGMKNKVVMLDAAGCAAEVEISPFVQAQIAAGISEFRRSAVTPRFSTGAELAAWGNLAVAAGMLKRTLPNMVCDSLKADITQFLADYEADKAREDERRRINANPPKPNKRRAACAEAGAAVRALQTTHKVITASKRKPAPVEYCDICSGSGELLGKPCTACGGLGTKA